jgi:hypothetical protein
MLLNDECTPIVIELATQEMFFREANKWVKRLDNLDYKILPDARNIPITPPKNSNLADSLFVALNKYKEERIGYAALLQNYRLAEEGIQSDKLDTISSKPSTRKIDELKEPSETFALDDLLQSIETAAREAPKTRFKEAIRLLNEKSRSKFIAARSFLTFINRAICSGMLTEGPALERKLRM